MLSPPPSAGNAPPASLNQVRTKKNPRRSHCRHASSCCSNPTALEIKPGSGWTEPCDWGRAGMLGAMLRAGVPARPRELGKGDGESQAALKQALQPARVRVGSSSPSAEVSLGRAAVPGCPLGWQKGIFQVLPPAGPSARRVPWLPAPPVASLFAGGFSSIPNPLLLIERRRLCAAMGDSFAGHGPLQPASPSVK